MKKRKIIPLVASLVIITGLALAANYTGWFNIQATVDMPSAREEYIKIYERFTQKDSVISIGGTITLLDGENRKTIKEKSEFSFIKRGSDCYSRIAYLQTYVNDNLQVQLDTVNKIIIVSKNTAPDGNATPSFDLLFNDTATFKLSGSVTGNYKERTLSLTSDYNPEIKKYSLTYDAVTYQVQKAEIEWWKDALVDTTKTDRIWITKINYRYLPAQELKTGEQISKIINIKKDKIEPVKPYEDYTLHVTF